LLRDAEFKADELGIRYLIASGYDPAEFRRALTSSEDSRRPASFFERLFDDHPMTADRIKRLDKVEHRVSFTETNYTLDTSEFQQIRARISMLANADVFRNKNSKNDH
jgi:predicted Zn-dependent protease